MSNILKDGGHVILECSNCNKPLVDLFIVKPNEKREDGTDFIWKCQAGCCYCNDKSFITEVKGIFRPGGIIKVSDENEDVYRNIVDIVDIEYDDNFVLFKTSRKK